MAELLAIAIAFPTVVYTVMLGVSLVYWAFVLLGAFDLHLIGGDGAIEGGAKGVLEGASKGVLEGAAKGVLEGASKGVLEGAAKGVLEGGGDGALEGSAKGALEGAKGATDGDVGADQSASILNALGFRKAPVTVVLTFLMAFSWLFSVLAMQTIGPIWPLPNVLLGILVMIVSFVLAVPITSLAVRPIGKLFVTHEAKANKDLVGRVCVVSTGTVDAKFGQALLEDGGAGLLIQIRSETPGALKRGDRALVLDWDEKSGGFVVEPLEKMLGELNQEERAHPGGARVRDLSGSAEPPLDGAGDREDAEPGGQEIEEAPGDTGATRRTVE